MLLHKTTFILNCFGLTSRFSSFQQKDLFMWLVKSWALYNFALQIVRSNWLLTDTLTKTTKARKRIFFGFLTWHTAGCKRCHSLTAFYLQLQLRNIFWKLPLKPPVYEICVVGFKLRISLNRLLTSVWSLLPLCHIISQVHRIIPK